MFRLNMFLELVTEFLELNNTKRSGNFRDLFQIRKVKMNKFTFCLKLFFISQVLLRFLVGFP